MTVDHNGADVTSVHIVGSGLIGASIGLALSATGVDVTLEDANPVNAAAALGRGAGRSSVAGDDAATHAQVVVVAVPPRYVVQAVLGIQSLNLNATFMDVASVKSGLIAEAETRGVDMARFVPTHPIAGRERGGPLNARSDLFEGRSWAVTAGRNTQPDHIRRTEWVIAACGGRPVNLSAGEHDAAMALVSHLPQIVASALAAELVGASFDVALLAGQGLRDSTRIAESDPQLWSDIVTANAAEIAPLVDRIRRQLDGVATALRSGDPRPAVERLVMEGQLGRSRVGATHGRPLVPVDVVSVLLRDTPGELARIFLALRDADVNVDDLRIDHAPGQPVGVLELVVAHEAGKNAVAALGDWEALVTRSTSR